MVPASEDVTQAIVIDHNMTETCQTLRQELIAIVRVSFLVLCSSDTYSSRVVSELGDEST